MSRAVVLTCQGSIQCVAAVAAFETECRRRAPELRDADVHLVIHGLYAEPTREAAFAEVVERIGRALLPLASVVWLSDAEVLQWGRRAERSSPTALRQALRDRIGRGALSAVEEIYLARNWLLGNELLTAAYPTARRICYGDGIGFHFTPRYGSPLGDDRGRYYADPGRAGHREGAFRRARHKLQEWLGRRTVLRPLPFDRGYFLLPETFGEPPDMPWERLPRELFQGLLEKLGMSAVAPERRLGGGGPRTVLVLTSNLSEALRLSSDAEIAAYTAFLEREGSDARLVLKPHPRERPEKISRLAEVLRSRFTSVEIWDEMPTACFPIEALLAREPILPQIVAFGTAALSAAFLFGVAPKLGFGEELVRRYFPVGQAEWRLRFEADLRNGVRLALGTGAQSERLAEARSAQARTESATRASSSSEISTDDGIHSPRR